MEMFLKVSLIYLDDTCSGAQEPYAALSHHECSPHKAKATLTLISRD